MKSQDEVKIIVAIACGLVFIIGFGIGIQLYSTTSRNNQESKIELPKTQYSI